MRKLTKAETLARLAYAFENFETMTRDQLIDFCAWNDPNGCYTDSDNVAEFGAPITLETLRDIVRDWKQDYQ